MILIVIVNIKTSNYRGRYNKKATICFIVLYNLYIDK